MFRGPKSDNITTALTVTLATLLIGSAPATAGADFDGDCCADLEARIAELENTTLQKGNKKLSVTLSGWMFKLGTWWNDGLESNLYWGDGETTLSSSCPDQGSRQIGAGMVDRLRASS